MWLHPVPSRRRVGMHDAHTAAITYVNAVVQKWFGNLAKTMARNFGTLVPALDMKAASRSLISDSKHFA